MLYRLKCLNKESGMPHTFEVEVMDEKSAREVAAKKGYVVESLEALPITLPLKHRTVPTYRNLDLISTAAECIGILSVIGGVLFIFIAVVEVSNQRNVSAAQWGAAGVTSLSSAVLFLGFGGALGAFRDLVINSWEMRVMMEQNREA